MFTYSTNLRGTVTATLNSVGGSALLDEDEEKVNEFLLFYGENMSSISFRQVLKRHKKISNSHHHGFFLFK